MIEGHPDIDNIPGFIGAGSTIRIDRPLQRPSELPPLSRELEARKAASFQNILDLKRRVQESSLARVATDLAGAEDADKPMDQ